LLVWLVLGSWSLAGVAHLLHRLDRRLGRGFLAVYLQSLAILDVWRGTLFAMAPATGLVVAHLSLGGFDVTPRLLSPAILLSVLAVFIAEGTAQATLLILNLFALGLAWGFAVPILIGLGGLLGWIPIPGGLADLLLSGSGARLSEVLALIVGIYASIISYQFLANRRWRIPGWLLGTLALWAGAIVQALLFGMGALWAMVDGPSQFLGELAGAVLSVAALMPVSIPCLRWLVRRARGSEGAADSRPAMAVLKEALDLRRALAESRLTVTRLSETLRILIEARHRIVQAVDPDQLMQDICDLLVRSRRYRFAWIGMKRQGDWVVFPAAQSGAGLDYLNTVTITWDESPTGQGPMGTAIRENRARVVEDTRTDERFQPWMKEALARGYLSVAGIPMRAGGEVVGGLAVYAQTPRAFSADELDLLQGVADDLAHGLGRLRAEQLNARRLRQLEILRAMTQDMISLRDVGRLLDRVLERAVDLLEGSSGGLYVCDRERGMLRAVAAFRLPIDILGVELRYGEGAAGRAAESGQGLIVPDYRAWPSRSSAYAPDAPLHAVLAAPMVWQGEVVGVIDVLRDEGMTPFAQGDLDLLQLFANQAALVLENARLIDGAQQRVEQLSLLHELTLAAIGAESRADFVNVLTRRMPALLKADCCMITRWDAEQGVPHNEGASGSLLEAVPRLQASPGEPTLTESALKAGKALAIEAVKHSSLLSPRLAAAFPTPSAIVIPLMVGARWFGAGFLGFDRPRAFKPEEIALAEQAGALVALAMAKLEAIEAEQNRSATLAALRQASLAVTLRLDLNAVLEAVLEHALKLFNGDDGHIFLFDGERLSFGAARWADAEQHQPYTTPRPDGMTMRVAQGGAPIVIPSVDEHPLFAEGHSGGAIIGMPLRVGTQVLGVMNLAFHRPRPLNEAELDDLQLLADQAALAIQNASLFAQADAERQRLRLLSDVGRRLVASVEPDAILQQAVSMTTQSLGGRSGGIFLLDQAADRLRLAAASRADGLLVEELSERLDLSLGRGLEGWVATHRTAARVEDVQRDERWIQIPGVDEGGGSAISAPLLVEDRLLGVMTILGDATFTQDHLDLLEAISRQVALALSNAGRYVELERRFREQVALQQVAQVISRRLEMQPLVEEVCKQVADVLGYPNVEIMLVEGEDLVMRAAKGAESAVGLHLPLARGIVGRVARTDRTAFAPDVGLDPDYVQAIATTRSEIVVPLHKGSLVIGVLNVESPVAYGLTEDDARLLSLLGDQVSVAIENAALYDRLRRHSTDLEQTVAERTARLAEALEQATEADQLKTQFVADVSHELRTPLTNIRLYLELISRAGRERFAEYLETLNRETERLVDLIEDLLAISRLDAGTHPPEMAPLDLNALARGLVADRRRMFDEGRLQVTFEPDEDLSEVAADGRLLTQVVANLMTNAMHYTLPGGRVSLATESVVVDGKHWATLRVTDTGLGIPADEQGHVFERFYRGTASRRMGTPGTGLGLSICKEILDRHGGRIQLQSRAGEGSTFTIWLPAGPDDARDSRR
jgi:GAF domain-containing protein